MQGVCHRGRIICIIRVDLTVSIRIGIFFYFRKPISVYKKLNDYTKAEAEYKQAISLNSKFEEAYIALAGLLSDMDRVPDAVNTYNAVLAFEPNSAKANFGLGKIYYDQKKYDKALPLLENAVKTEPDYVLAYNVLGLTYKGLRRYDEAVSAFEKAISNERRRTSKGSYYYYMGETLLVMKKYNQAEEAFTNAINSTRSNTIKAGSNFHLGEVFRDTGQKQKALQYFQIAAKNSSWKQAAEYEIDIIKNPDKYVN